MSNASKIAVPLLLLGAGATAFFYVNQSGNDLPTPTPPAVVHQDPKPQPKVEPAPVAQAAPVTTHQEPQRTEARPTDGNAHTDAKQGVKGRVLQPNGAPAAGVPLYVMENSMNNPLQNLLANASGKRTPPVSSGVTAADGTFALGILVPEKLYDLRVVPDDYPEKVHSQVKPHEDDWFDLGDLTLEPGTLVTGRVIDETTKAGVADATVYLSNANDAHTMIAAPGRERGIFAVTDKGGAFRLANAPRQGIVTLTAEAKGYANGLLQNQPIKPDGQNEFTLELAAGRPIAGVVVDADGKPIGGVQITASGLSAKTPQTATTNSQSDGTFQFECLREGPYQLLTRSTQYNEVKTPPVMTGDLEVKVVLAQRAFAKLRVLGANKVALKSYSLSLKRHFPNNPLGIGNVPEFADRRINPSDYPAEFNGDWAVIRGLPTGDFVFQIQDNAHAKTLSPAFHVAENEPPAEVEVVLTLGGVIYGRVVDDSGAPVAGATVSTDMNNAMNSDEGIFGIFKQFIPEKHSKASVQTDGQGNFKMTKLAFAEYMVRVSHPSFCEGSAFDIKLETEGQQVDAGTLRLNRGAIVEGLTTIAGQAYGQIKVAVSSPQQDTGTPRVEAPNNQANQMAAFRAMFSASAISDNNGQYRLLKRVPPGTYKIHACRESGDNNPFLKLLDMKETERQLIVTPGQDRIQIDFNLSKR